MAFWFTDDRIVLLTDITYYPFDLWTEEKFRPPNRKMSFSEHSPINGLVQYSGAQ